MEARDFYVNVCSPLIKGMKRFEENSSNSYWTADTDGRWIDACIMTLNNS